MLTPNELVFTYEGSYVCRYQFWWKSIKKCDREVPTDGHRL